jgi:hypothetical protein
MRIFRRSSMELIFWTQQDVGRIALLSASDVEVEDCVYRSKRVARFATDAAFL